MAQRHALALAFILSLAFCGPTFAQDNPQPIDDTVEDFDAIVDEGNPLESDENSNALGQPMPDKDPSLEPLPELDLDEPAPVLTEDEFELENEVEQSTVQRKPDPIPLIRQENTKIIRENKSRRYIEHPNAQKGLIRIDKDRVYYYKSEESEKKFSLSFAGGFYDPNQLVNNDTGYAFSDVYDNSNFPMLLLNYEKQLFDKLPAFRYYFGGGLFVATGKGTYNTNTPPTDPDETPQEQFTLFVFPLSVGANFYLQIWEKQWIVPYGGGGLTGFVFGERRDDDLNPDLGAKWGISPAAHFQGGALIKLGSGPRSFIDLDREYGINSMWLTVEYKNFTALSDKYDFSSDYIGGGLYLVY